MLSIGSLAHKTVEQRALMEKLQALDRKGMVHGLYMVHARRALRRKNDTDTL